MEEPITNMEAPKFLQGKLRNLYAISRYSSQGEDEFFVGEDEELKGSLSSGEKQIAVLNEREWKENTQWNP
jgi:hypothetical protein